MHKEFRCNEIKNTFFTRSEKVKSNKLIQKSLGEILESQNLLKSGQKLYDYVGSPITSLDDIILVEMLIKYGKKKKRLFRITPIIVKIEEIKLEE